LSGRVRERHLLPVQPWFSDHGVSGKTVLPAVETLLFLAARAQEFTPDVDVATMLEARFKKFLEFGDELSEREVLVELEVDGQELIARLQSEVALKAMTRIKEHGEVRFPLSPRPAGAEEWCMIDLPEKCPIHYSAEDIYQDLVPFGPAYRTLHGTLFLEAREALGTLRAPTMMAKQSLSSRLGSPFPFDGAMHAACVLGQQYADFIPFPVGFSRRRVLHPTRPGEEYRVRASLVAESALELVFDLRIADGAGRLCEAIDSLSMRSVGLAKPSTH